LRYVTVGNYQISALLLLMIVLISPIAFAATYYLWTTRTIPLSIDEPLSITDYPDSIHVRPGENKTLDISILNSASVNYSVTLVFTLNNTEYQESYVEFSNHTYSITPSVNHIRAWINVDKKAPPVWLSLTTDFYRE